MFSGSTNSHYLKVSVYSRAVLLYCIIFSEMTFSSLNYLLEDGTKC